MEGFQLPGPLWPGEYALAGLKYLAVQMARRGFSEIMKMDMPDPRKDGKCVDCKTSQAETYDGRLCKKYLRTRLEEKEPTVYTKIFSDQRGRKDRSTQILGGCA